jgi:hypothetical protein
VYKIKTPGEGLITRPCNERLSSSRINESVHHVKEQISVWPLMNLDVSTDDYRMK